MAGAGWETSYTAPVLVQGPEDETQIRERQEREAREREELEGPGWEGPPPPPPSKEAYSESEGQQVLLGRALANQTIPAPHAAGGGGASASALIKTATVKPLKDCQKDHCGIWWIELRNPSYYYETIQRKQGRGGPLDAVSWVNGTEVEVVCWRNPIYYPELSVEPHRADKAGPTYVIEGEHKHLTIYGQFTVTANVWVPLPDEDFDVFAKSAHYALLIWVWPNGEQLRIIRHWTPGIFEDPQEA